MRPTMARHDDGATVRTHPGFVPGRARQPERPPLLIAGRPSPNPTPKPTGLAGGRRGIPAIIESDPTLIAETAKERCTSPCRRRWQATLARNDCQLELCDDCGISSPREPARRPSSRPAGLAAQRPRRRCPQVRGSDTTPAPVRRSRRRFASFRRAIWPSPSGHWPRWTAGCYRRRSAPESSECFTPCAWQGPYPPDPH